MTSSETPPDREGSYDDISDEDWNLMTVLALGDDHVAQLNAKVEAAMQEEWDLTAGVMSGRKKAAPLKINVDMWSFNAKKEMQKGNFSGAEFWYDKCSKYNPRDGRAWLGLARILWKRGDKVNAERTYKEGLYFDQKNPYLLQAYSVLLEKTGRVEAATALLTKSVRIDPKHAASWVSLAKLHQRAGRIDEAQFCFSSAVENDPSSYVAYQAWGVLESEKGNIDRARELFRSAISISRECAHAYQAWATMEKRQGRLDDALQLLNESLTVFPQNTRTRETYAEILELQGGGGAVKEVRGVFKGGERFAVQSGDAGFFQSWAMFEQRQMQSLLYQARGGKRLSGGFIDSADILDTETEAKLREVEAAGCTKVRKLFKQAVSINKYHSASWVAWAKFEQRQGNLEAARKLLVSGISNFPHSKNIAWFHCGLANIARQERDLNTARACYARALSTTANQKTLPILLEYASMEADLAKIIADFDLKIQNATTTISSTPMASLSVNAATQSGTQGQRTGMWSESSQISTLERDKEAALALSVREARKLFEIVVKRFPSEKRGWDAYIDFETRNQQLIAGASSSPFYSTGGASGSSRERIRILTQRRNEAMSASKSSVSMLSTLSIGSDSESGDDMYND